MELSKQVKETQKQMAAASEEREAENKEFQDAVRKFYATLRRLFFWVVLQSQENEHPLLTEYLATT